MATALNIPQTVSPVDALWTLFQGQTKKVKKEFIGRIMDLVDTENSSAHKMTYADISARLDAAEKDIKEGNFIACEDVHRNIEDKCPWL